MEETEGMGTVLWVAFHYLEKFAISVGLGKGEHKIRSRSHELVSSFWCSELACNFPKNTLGNAIRVVI